MTNIDGGDNLDPGVYFAPGSKSWFGMTDIQAFFSGPCAVASPRTCRA